MKKILILLLFVPALCFGISSQENANIMAASITTIPLYKSKGMSGLVENIKNCYQNKPSMLCVYLDMSGKYFDDSFKKVFGIQNSEEFRLQMGTPLELFFLDDSVFNRIRTQLNTDNESTLEFIKKIMPKIQLYTKTLRETKT